MVGQSIVKTSGRKDIQYYFTVLASNDLFALACPGGFIFITEGMVKQLKNEAELAGVLAHEIAHINQKHILINSNQMKIITVNFFHRLLMAKHTTGTVAFHEIGSKASELLLNKGMHQNDEYEADIAAVFYLKNTGYLPQSYIDVIQRLPHDTTTHTHNHPSIDQRIADVKAMFPADYLKSGVTLEGRFNRHALR